jgi:hypothetical protein
MNANNVSSMLVHELDNNTYLQTLENYYMVGLKAHNFVGNVNPSYTTQMNKKTNNGNSKIIKCGSIYNPLKIQKD